MTCLGSQRKREKGRRTIVHPKIPALVAYRKCPCAWRLPDNIQETSLIGSSEIAQGLGEGVGVGRSDVGWVGIGVTIQYAVCLRTFRSQCSSFNRIVRVGGQGSRARRESLLSKHSFGSSLGTEDEGSFWKMHTVAEALTGHQGIMPYCVRAEKPADLEMDGSFHMKFKKFK